MLLDLVDVNYLKTALSNSSYFLALTFFLFKLAVPVKNVAIIFSLFAGKSYVEIVFLGTPHLSTTNDSGCLFSATFNALDLSSMEVLLFYVTSASFLRCYKYKNIKI